MNDIKNFTKESNILSIEVLDEYEDMVDLTVEDVHCYYANDMLTHNCGEEINICANLSGDDTWCNAINEGKDIHMECYSDDTEILTDRGFVLFKDLKKEHKVAEFCDGKFQFTNDYTTSVYDYKGKMCHFKTKVTDILVTPNHRMYGRTDKTRCESFKSNIYQFLVAAGDMDHSR